MPDPDHAVLAEADVFASFVGQRLNARFAPLRTVIADGVAIAFYDRGGSGLSGSELLAVVLEADPNGRWTALGAKDFRAGGSRGTSMRPSKRGDWIIAVYGSAPPETREAIIEYEGQETRIPVASGVYGFVTRAVTEPRPVVVRPRFE
jgi:hypothetical protein